MELFLCVSLAIPTLVLVTIGKKKKKGLHALVYKMTLFNSEWC